MKAVSFIRLYASVGLVAAALIVSCRGENGEDQRARHAARELRDLTGAPTRIVWCQDMGEGTDLLAYGDKFRLMGFDTEDRRGARPILEKEANYSKPMITPKGDRIVFSNRKEYMIYVVNWDGSGLKPLLRGHAVDVWMNPADGTEWVYYGADPLEGVDQNLKSYSGFSRFRIDDPSVSEPVWDKTEVMQLTENNFQLSADGARASLWGPSLGVAELPNVKWEPYGKGCWPSLAPDNSYVFWHFDGGHRSMTAYSPGGGNDRRIVINGAPGVDGGEVFHPRWSNHARFFSVSGPLEIAGGGPEVEVYIGRLDDRVTAVEQWARVTYNERADFFPDVWIAGGEKACLAYPQKPAAVAAAPAPAAAQPSTPRARAVVEARLVETSAIPAPATIAPYRRALVANRYEIVKVLEGDCPHKEIMAAHWAIRDAQVLDAARRQTGQVYRMTLESYDDSPELEGERLIMDGDQFLLPLFVDING